MLGNNTTSHFLWDLSYIKQNTQYLHEFMIQNVKENKLLWTRVMSFKIYTTSKKLKNLFHGNQLIFKLIFNFWALSQQIMIETCCKLGFRLQMLHKSIVYELYEIGWQQVVIQWNSLLLLAHWIRNFTCTCITL